MSDTAAVHRHRVFDLEVVSCLALPAAAGAPAGGPAEIAITLGEVPSRLPDAVEEGFRRHVAPGRVLLCVDGVARYLIEEGRRMTIAREPGADDDDVRTFLLGPAFGALLQQRDELVLRASAVGREGVAVLLLGPAGVGKSSLAVALSRRGWTVLAEDVAGVRALPDDAARVAKAIRFSRFEEVQRQDRARAFAGRGTGGREFFRKGETGSWRGVLSPAHVERLIADHGDVMRRFEDLIPTGEPAS